MYIGLFFLRNRFIDIDIEDIEIDKILEWGYICFYYKYKNF